MSQSDVTVLTTPEHAQAGRHLVRAYARWLLESHPEQSDDILAFYSPELLRRAVAEIPDAFTRPNGLALIARADGAPVGCVFVSPLEPGMAEIKRLFVLPGARGLGLGARLVRTAIEHMEAWGRPTIRLETATYLTDAIALYRRLGFAEIAPHKQMPTGSVKVAIFMERRAEAGLR